MLSFNKYFYEETQTPNIKIVEDEKGNISHYNDQGKVIYIKYPKGTEQKYNDQGYLIYKKHPDGTEEKYNDQGKLIYIKHPDGKEQKYNDQGNLIYKKDPDGTEHFTEYKYNDQGKVIYKKHPDGTEYKYNDQGKVIYQKDRNGVEYFTEYKYNDQGKLIYQKNSDGTEYKYNDQGKVIYQKDRNGVEYKYNDQGKVIYIKYPDGTEEKYNDQGNLIYIKDPDGKEQKYDEYGLLTKERQIAIKKAENYMRDYHGMFLHAFNPNSLDNTLNIPENHEVCVSTVRSSTIFRSENKAIVFIGFGNIRELYDFDAYSAKISEGEKKGARYATANIKQSPALHDIKLDNLKTYHKEFNRSNYYDEGFMALADADVIIASLPNEYSEEFPEFTKQIKSVYPNIKIINSKQFERIKDSDSLLTLLYRLKQERDDKELMDKPFNKYEEKFILFKDFFLL